MRTYLNLMISERIYYHCISAKMKGTIAVFIVCLLVLTENKIVFQDNFDELDFTKWKHDITLAGGGNWEFELYDNNRSTTFVKDGKLNIKPVLT